MICAGHGNLYCMHVKDIDRTAAEADMLVNPMLAENETRNSRVPVSILANVDKWIE